MLTSKVATTLFALALGIVVATGARAAGVAAPNDAVSTANETVSGAGVCPTNILCNKSQVARCGFNIHARRCVCHCVPRD
jgi:hypothetical protein